MSCSIEKRNLRMNTILFDGICNLCNGTVLFLKRKDKRCLFRFVSLQSETGKYLLEKFNISGTTMDTLIYIRDKECLQKSTAIIQILYDLGGRWKVFYIFHFIPTRIRDAVYKIISRHRYKLFGKRISCTKG